MPVMMRSVPLLGITSIAAVGFALLCKNETPILAFVNWWDSALIMIDDLLAVPSTAICSPTADEVVVVLGYKMFGDGTPSPLLHLRLAAAAAYIHHHQWSAGSDARFELVLSGGVPSDGPDGPDGKQAPSEAAAMHAHLRTCFPTALRAIQHRGAQVLLETAAHSTHTNALNTIRCVRQRLRTSDFVFR
eukprot:SAG31_NODE_8400_length_1458_cov_2.668138_2_plen_189_part_00